MRPPTSLIDEGFEALEVPLNSPEPLVTIEAMVRRHLVIMR